MTDRADDYFIRGRDSNTRRQAGASAFEKAQALRKQAPVRTLLARALGARTEERAWRLGGDGENRLAKSLEPLTKKGWYLFHDLPIGERGANLDHLAIGPAGVFSINTKNLRGNVWVAQRAFLHNGHKTAYLPKSRREGERVGKLFAAAGFTVSVHAVLAVYCANLTIKQQPEDVSVLRGEGLMRWLIKKPAMIETSVVFRLAAAADDPSFWSGDRERPSQQS